MADAIHRSEHGVTMGEDIVQPPAAFLDPAVVVNERTIGALDKCSKMGDQADPAAHIDDPLTVEIDGGLPAQFALI